MEKQDNKLIFTAALLILAAAFTRLFPHPPNFTAIGAMAIFAGSVVKEKKYALLFPLVALFVSDVCLQLFTSVKGFYGTSQLFVYAAFIIITILSSFINKSSVSSLVFATIWSGLIFFAISNIGVWLSGDTYPKSFSGLGACFMAALPFYKNDFFGNFLLNTIMSNLFFTAVLFYVFELAQKLWKSSGLSVTK